jgi:hypothetical protein
MDIESAGMDNLVGAKADESPKATEPADENDNPFNEPGDGSIARDVPF